MMHCGCATRRIGRNQAVGLRDSAPGHHPSEGNRVSGLGCAEVPSVALVQSVNDSRRAWRNFFDSATGKRKGGRVGRPRMKSRKDHRQSFRLTRNGFRVRPGGRLFVAKVGEVQVRWSRELPSAAVVGHDHPGTRRALLREFRGRCRQRRHYRSCSARPGWMWASPGWRRSPPPTTTSRRGEPEVPGPQAAKLRRLEREKSRRQQGSTNRDKTRRKVAIAHARWRGRGATITISRRWRWFARTK